ncbi:TonB-dependent receptor [Polaribacter sp. BAL334]|uniref:SusC/RagA family TonB-linked outer membrane protein n=1 Tax=Polaribacter sp. BAL334 TaxID=1708178 RepID=UPI0018D211CD|nr:TonB-dependent receptor [Polaribacter sp. BAL334]MBG7613132.1 TonB-dependent receptor [Polaribacter sp. BAL334]
MKLTKKRSVLLLIFLGIIHYSFSQTITVSGTVTDAKKNPLPGVEIIIASKNIGKITDLEGKYSISTEKGDKLSFFYLGMETKVVTITDQTTLDIILLESFENLDEIVIIGYQTVKRSDVTGSVSTIKGSDIVKQPTPNLASALVGKASGVYVRTTGSEPGGTSSIKIRGLNSINGTGEPLYVIDGIYSDDIDFLNPSDVESIEILKDAAETAIYGSRGANGVVLITTKSAKIGKTNISYSHFFSYKNATRDLDVVNAREYATLFYEMKANTANLTIPNILPNEEIPGFPENDPDSWGEGTNWLDETSQFWSLVNHDFKLNYGKEGSAIGFGVNYVRDDGAFQGQKYQRMNINLNAQFDVTKAIEFGFKINGNRSEFDQLRDGQRAIASIYGTAPVIPVYNEDGSYNFSNVIGEPNQFENPLARLLNSFDENNIDRVLSNFFVNINLAKKLKLAVSLKYNYTGLDRKNYLPSTTLEGSLTNGKANVLSIKTADLLNNYILTYSLNKGKHNINFLGGMEIGKRVRNTLDSGNVTEFNTDIYGPFNLGAGAFVEGYGSAKIQETLLGFLGRINYKFNDKYYLTLTGRYDGSSKFGANNKWALFPGVAVAWDMSKEKFLADSKVISNWKWRLSAGQSGSSSILPYQSLGSIYNLGLAASTPTYVFGNNEVQAEAPQSFDNPDLKWEVATQYNFGFDMSLWKGRVNINADVYYKLIEDLLVRNFVLPGVSGFEQTTVNAGDMTNTGVDLSIGATIIKKEDFTFATNLVFSHYKNKITRWISEAQLIREPKYTGFVGQGYAYGIFWEVPQLGIFPDQASIDNYTYTDPVTGDVSLLQPSSLPGDIKYLDTNGDGKINADDRTEIGSPHPDFTLGVGIDLTYKRWTFNAFINAVIGKDIYNGSNEELLDTEQFNTNNWNQSFGVASTVSRRMLNRWTPDNTITDIPRLGSRGFDGVSANLSNVENGDYIRLENISLSYDIPIDKIPFITRLSVFASAQNAILITRYKGTDPENNQPDAGGWATNQSPNIMALDDFAYPRPAIYTFGFNVNF